MTDLYGTEDLDITLKIMETEYCEGIYEDYCEDRKQFLIDNNLLHSETLTFKEEYMTFESWLKAMDYNLDLFIEQKWF